LIGQTRGYLRPGETITIPALNRQQPDLTLRMIDREEEGVWQMEPSLSGTPVEILPHYGVVPLPPYIERSADDADLGGFALRLVLDDAERRLGFRQ